jgi:hypothetical protein
MQRTLILLLTAFCCGLTYADTYEVTVSRKGSNIYKASGKDIIIQTRHCYAYAYSEDAILKGNGYGGEIIFPESRDKCDVKAVFGPSTQKSGKFKVMISRDDDDWYEVFGTNTYIKTSACLSLALGEEAIFNHRGSGIGTLNFKDGTDCMVEGVYSKMRL